MGCAIFKIAKKFENHNPVEVPNFIFISKTINSSNFMSASDSENFSSELISEIHNIQVPLLELEKNQLRKKRFLK